MRHYRALLGEALHVLGFLGQVRKWNEQRKIGVLVTGRFELPVEAALNVLPNAVAPRLDHHAAAYIRVLGKVRLANDLLIPRRVILIAAGIDGGLLVIHGRERQPSLRSASIPQSTAAPEHWLR